MLSGNIGVRTCECDTGDLQTLKKDSIGLPLREDN